MNDLTTGANYSQHKWKGDVSLMPHTEDIHSDHAPNRALIINWINQTTYTWLLS